MCTSNCASTSRLDIQPIDEGAVKIVRQTYIGPADELAAALEKQPTALKVLPESPVYDLGAEAALLDLARELGVADIVDRHVPRRGS